jgi:hypothetical protein
MPFYPAKKPHPDEIEKLELMGVQMNPSDPVAVGIGVYSKA